MKIVADQHIPFLAETIRAHWQEMQICPMKPEEIDSSAVRDADVLVVRTRTHVGESLLKDSRVRLVCTATIGFDHIDTAWCEAHGIHWISCPGCNAQAVCDYIEEALEEYMPSAISNQRSAISHQLIVGVVGVGHVGSLVAEMAERKGYRVLLNDPPKGIGVPLDTIAGECDIITFHVPLINPQHEVTNTQSPTQSHPTYHLCDEAFLSRCKPGALIINAARGGVVDEQALLQSGHPYILDTWEGEPQLNRQVLQHAFRASMHIAGYSLQGKINATNRCLRAISEEFGLPILSCDKNLVTLQPISGDTAPGWLGRITAQLKNAPDAFEQLRKTYILR